MGRRTDFLDAVAFRGGEKRAIEGALWVGDNEFEVKNPKKTITERRTVTDFFLYVCLGLKTGSVGIALSLPGVPQFLRVEGF